MAHSMLPGLSARTVLARAGDRIELPVVQRPLSRLLAFTGLSIDDVINDPLAKNLVLGYHRLHRQILRQGEISDLERQWNPLATR